MIQPKEVVLNIHYVRNRIAELDLKQWWLAEEIGVDQKTIRRWLQGKVKQVKYENAKTLAEKLACPLDDIVLTSDEELLATPEDQKRAAEMISSSQLMEKLGPIQEWDVLEALLKATIIPNLPAFVLGELYNKLSVACWRQSKLDQASIYADKAHEIGRRLDDKTVTANATLSQANILSWRGETKDSIAKYEECLKLKKYIPEKTLGSVCSNLGALYWETGDLEKGLQVQLEALEIFKDHGNDMNRSICQAQLSFIYLETKDLELAKNAAELSLKLAKNVSYLRGECMGHLVLGEIAAYQGESELAEEKIELGLKKFADLDIEEGFNYEFAARTHRVLGNYETSERFLHQGIQISKDYPVYLASLYRELGFLQIAKGDPDLEAQKSFKKSIELFTSCQAANRVEQVKSILNSMT